MTQVTINNSAGCEAAVWRYKDFRNAGPLELQLVKKAAQSFDLWNNRFQHK